jgi:hypothetical protein
MQPLMALTGRTRWDSGKSIVTCRSSISGQQLR